MDILLDTHLFIWWQEGILEKKFKSAFMITDPENCIIISTVVLWEVAIKRASGKLHFNGSARLAALEAGFEILDINAFHAERAGALPMHHGDPFDRMLVAQALEENLVLATVDRTLAAYNVPLLGAF